MQKDSIKQRLDNIERKVKAIKNELYDNKQPCLVEEVKFFFKQGHVALDASGNWYWHEEDVNAENGWLSYSQNITDWNR